MCRALRRWLWELLTVWLLPIALVLAVSYLYCRPAWRF
jgi:hypothetical protein